MVRKIACPLSLKMAISIIFKIRRFYQGIYQISFRCHFLLFRVLRCDMSIVGTNDDFVWLWCGILKKLDLLVMKGRVFLLLDHF